MAVRALVVYEEFETYSTPWAEPQALFFNFVSPHASLNSI